MRDDWFTREDPLGHKVSSWAVKKNNSVIFCKICSSDITCEGKGFQALQQHAKTTKHRDNAKAKLNIVQLHLTGRSDLPNNESLSVPVPACSTPKPTQTLFSRKELADQSREEKIFTNYFLL